MYRITQLPVFKFFLAIIVCALMMSMDGCDSRVSDTDEKQTAQTEKLVAEANRQVGMPNIVNFQERKLAKMILELRDQENVINYFYTQAEMTGKLNYIGRCVGFGIPASVQFTNPEREIGTGLNGTIATIPQPDPSGLFMPDGLDATFVMMIDPKDGKPKASYWEPKIVVSPFKLH
jgi:hypothetical protein